MAHSTSNTHSHGLTALFQRLDPIHAEQNIPTEILFRAWDEWECLKFVLRIIEAWVYAKHGFSEDKLDSQENSHLVKEK